MVGFLVVGHIRFTLWTLSNCYNFMCTLLKCHSECHGHSGALAYNMYNRKRLTISRLSQFSSFTRLKFTLALAYYYR